ncbi:MAG: hypothetical protein HC903_28150 [Methylacidiphilales bacterium]|nr:hypothetical protein [Candidatus Methylacidiphilales bacterium]
MAARSNLVPTPYAIKMALLKALLESQGKHHHEHNQNDFDTWIKREFTWIRDLQIYIFPPEQLVVNRNGYKLRYYDQTADKADKTRATLPMQDGFVFREWIHLQGELQICAGINQDVSNQSPEQLQNQLQELTQLFAQINYFGKKGCFFQYLPDRTQTTNQPTFIPNPNDSFTIQPMDDFGAKTTFNRINPFTNDRATIDKDRIIKPGFLPLKLRSTSARYDYYQRD